MLHQGGGERDVALAVEGLQVGPVLRRFRHADGEVEGGGEAGDDGGNARFFELGADAVHQVCAVAVETFPGLRLAQAVQGGDGGGHGDGLAVIGAAVHHALGEFIEQACLAGDGGDGEAVGDGLGEGGEIWRDAEFLLGAAGADAEAGDHLIEHQHGAVFGAGLAGGFQVAGLGEDAALVAHGGFHDDHGYVPLGEAGFQRRGVVPGQDGDVHRRIHDLAAAAGDGAGGAGGRGGGPQHVVEPAVVVALELHHHAAAGGGAGDAQRRLHGFGTAGAEAHPLGAGDHLAHQAGGFGFQAGLAAVEDAAVELGLHGGNHVGRVVAQDHRAHGEVVVDQAVAVGVDQAGAFAAFQHQRGGGNAQAEVRGDTTGEVFGGLGNAAAGFVEGQLVIGQGVATIGGGGHSVFLPAGGGAGGSCRGAAVSRHWGVERRAGVATLGHNET